MIEISEDRFRGDTEPYAIQVLNDDGTVKDVTGLSYTLTASEEKNPTSTDGQLFQSEGNIRKASRGYVEFPFDEQDVDIEIDTYPPKEVYFDIEQTDAQGNTLTIAKGKFLFHQDITK